MRQQSVMSRWGSAVVVVAVGNIQKGRVGNGVSCVVVGATVDVFVIMVGIRGGGDCCDMVSGNTRELVRIVTSCITSLSLSSSSSSLMALESASEWSWRLRRISRIISSLLSISLRRHALTAQSSMMVALLVSLGLELIVQNNYQKIGSST